MVRTLIFMVFFSIGAAAIGGSILCDDLTAYFRSKQLLRDAEESAAQLKSLNTDYDILLNRLEEDPNLFERIAPAALGIERQEPNTVYPSATVEQLGIARRALSAAQGSTQSQQARTGVEKWGIENRKSKMPAEAGPVWLIRCSEPRRRLALFFAGAGLILVSFICFGSTANKPICD